MTRNKLPIIGLTGLSGSGKTTAARLLSQRGGFCVIADDIAHEVILRGEPAYGEIIAAFGNGILGKNHEIDRRKLGGMVFGQPDNDNMRVLEGIIHPRVTAETRRRISRAADEGKYPFAVIDAALLIEAGIHAACDSVWLVSAPEALRKERIMHRDGLTEEEARKRLSNRGGEGALLPHAHAVIVNDGGAENLTDIINRELKRLGYA
jgi:dephospho-CoA kinase